MFWWTGQSWTLLHSPAALGFLMFFGHRILDRISSSHQGHLQEVAVNHQFISRRSHFSPRCFPWKLEHPNISSCISLGGQTHSARDALVPGTAGFRWRDAQISDPASETPGGEWSPGIPERLRLETSPERQLCPVPTRAPPPGTNPVPERLPRVTQRAKGIAGITNWSQSRGRAGGVCCCLMSCLGPTQVSGCIPTVLQRGVKCTPSFIAELFWF